MTYNKTQLVTPMRLP